MKKSVQLLSLLICGVAFQISPALARSSSPGVSTGLYINSEGAHVTDLIDQAQSTIQMEVYEMDDPKVIASLRNALNRGVSVSIVKEPKPVGAVCKVFETESIERKVEIASAKGSGGATCADQKALVAEVIQSGGQYVPFTKPDLCGGNGTKNCLEHGKTLVVDSKEALISSGNFNTTNLCDLEYSPMTCNRDYSYITDDQDVVSTLGAVIEKDVSGNRYDIDSVMTRDSAAKLTVGPNSLEPLVSFIQSAKRSIIIENQYLKDPTLNAALIAAARRGVSVQVVIASACSFGKPKATEARKLSRIFQDFEEARIKLRMFTKNVRVNGRTGYLHAKAIVVDGVRAWMGSVNGSTQATTLNREFGVFFSNSSDVKKLNSQIIADFKADGSESWQDSLQCAENHR